MFLQFKIHAVDVFCLCGNRATQQPVPYSTAGGDVYTIPSLTRPTSDQEPQYDVIQLGTPTPAADPYDTLYSETPQQKHEYKSLDIVQDEAHRQQDMKDDYEEV